MARYGGGFGGGAPNMQQLLRQAQDMQKKMQEAQEELADLEVIGRAGGDMVEVIMGCDYTISSVKIKPEAIDPDDPEMLEDLIVAGIGEALKLIEEQRDEILGPLGGGQGLF